MHTTKWFLFSASRFTYAPPRSSCFFVVIAGCVPLPTRLLSALGLVCVVSATSTERPTTTTTTAPVTTTTPPPQTTSVGQ